MTNLLDEAISRLRERPAADQDHAAEAILSYLESADRRDVLTPDQIEDVKRIQDDLRTGKTRLATNEEVAALWRSFGV